MIQVKSGRGNVGENAEGFTYYMSNVHYEYYMRVEMPVVFVLYLPDDRIANWVLISQATLEATQTRWKLSIPRNQLLNESSKPVFTEILDEFYTRKMASSSALAHRRSIAELTEDLGRIGEARIHLESIASAQTTFNASIGRVTKDLARYNSKGLIANSREITSAIARANSLFQHLAQALNQSIARYADSFSRSGTALEIIIQQYGHEQDLAPEFPSVLITFRGLREALDSAMLEVGVLLTVVEGLTTDFPSFRPGRANAISAIDNLATELRDSRSLLTRLILLIESRLLS